MRKILLVMLLSIALITESFAVNFYVRSNTGSGPTVIWSPGSAPQDIFAKTSPTGAPSTTWPTSGDIVYADGVELRMTAGITAPTSWRGLIVRYSGGGVDASTKITLKDYLQIFDHATAGVYFDELEITGQTVTNRYFEGTFVVNKLIVKPGPGNIANFGSFENSNPTNTRTGDILVIGECLVSNGTMNHNPVLYPNVPSTFTFKYVSENDAYGRFTDVGGTISGTYQFQQKLYSELTMAPNQYGHWLHINSPFGTITQDWVDDAYTWGWVGSDYGPYGWGLGYTNTPFPSVMQWQEDEDEGFFFDANDGWTSPHYHWFSPHDTELDMSRGQGVLIAAVHTSWILNNPTLSEFYLTTEGTPSFGTFNFDVTYTPSAFDTDSEHSLGVNHLSNPYLAVLDFDELTFNNVDQMYWIHDNENNAWDYYETFTGGEGTATGMIPPGKAFYVKATGSSPSLTATSSAIESNATPGLKSSNGEKSGSYMNYIRFQPDNMGNAITLLDVDNITDLAAPAYGEYCFVQDIGEATDLGEDRFGVLDLSATGNSETIYLTLKVTPETQAYMGSTTFDIDLNGFTTSGHQRLVYYRLWDNNSSDWSSIWTEITPSVEYTLENTGLSSSAEIDDTNTSLDDGGYANFVQFKIAITRAGKSVDEVPEEKVTIRTLETSNIFDMTKYGEYTIEVYNISGQLIVSDQFKGFTYTLNSANLSSGIYSYKISREDKIFTGKFNR